jgi:hypothetical protein
LYRRKEGRETTKQMKKLLDGKKRNPFHRLNTDMIKQTRRGGEDADMTDAN